MLVGRYNAVEFVVVGGRPFVRRYLVHASVIESGAVIRADLADEPDEERRLPLTRDDALGWVHRHFEDLSRERRRELVDRLTKPTRPTIVRRTGPLA